MLKVYKNNEELSKSLAKYIVTKIKKKRKYYFRLSWWKVFKKNL